MSRYIDSDALMDFLTTIPIDLGDREIDDVKEYVERQPAADVAPVRHGRWERDEMTGVYICSVCDNGYEEQPTLMGKPMFDYCPVCGTKMDARP